MKKVLSLLLLLCMMVSLMACNNEDSKNTGSDGTATTEKSSVTEGSTAAATPALAEDLQFGAYPETVSISTATSEYSSAKYPEGDDITNNVWIRAYKEKFNIDVVTDWVSDEYDTKLNLAISSGELPDVFRVTGAQLKQLVEADMVWDLTQAYDTYASDLLKSYMAGDQASFESGMTDGKLYGIAQMHWGIIDQPDYIWIRKDWKEALKLEDPKTMDDVVAISKAFMEAGYSTYGMAIDQTLDYINILAPAWNAHPDLWLEGADGSIVYGSAQPEMKAALSAWAQWYKDGIFNPDFATLDFNAMNEPVVSGQVGVQPYYQWWGYNPGVDTVSNNGPEAIFEPYLIPSAVGEDKVIQSIFSANGTFTVVSKDCKNPEAVFKLLNFYGYMVDESTGVEDGATISAFTDNDMAHVVGAFRVLNPNCDYQQFAQVSKSLASGDTSNLTTSGMWQKYNNSVEFKTNKTPGSTGDYMQQGNEKSAYGLSTYILDNKLYLQSKLWGASPDSLLNYGTTLDDLLTEGFTKIIMGVEDVDYFDTLVENWAKAGGDEVTAEINEMYGK